MSETAISPRSVSTVAPRDRRRRAASYVTTPRTTRDASAIAAPRPRAAQDERDPHARVRLSEHRAAGRDRVASPAGRRTRMPRAYSVTVTLIILTGVLGRSLPSVGVVSIFFTTSMPEVTLPNTGCFDGPGREPVEAVVVDGVDEELRAARVRAAGVRHRQRARLVRDLVRGRVLVLDVAERRVAGAAARAVRILRELTAELDHEVVDDAVEVEPVVEADLRELDEVAGGDRHLVRRSRR